jgi:hypothetical protein
MPPLMKVHTLYISIPLGILWQGEIRRVKMKKSRAVECDASSS